ncbi:3-hydroxyacyl-CoA dehydrogenase family protein [Halorhabdus amylolytica]|uniref:3-hydroxyacyl-CoA dehydrogenase family protein n=1 Tax=Halorhabdus amylolytica TaxID=2559573 RepID=UPI0010A9E569|nr:3-hydroxyacyl-CoA dehydrogenase family protein [Halorhabdus amylolytica]
MDVAIIGTGEAARRFAKAAVSGSVVTGHGTGEAADGAPAISLFGSEATAVMDAIDAIEEALGAAAEPQPTARLDRIDGTTDLEAAVEDAAIVIETREDDVETIRDRLAAVEEEVGPDVVLATCIDRAEMTAIAVGLERPGRAVGLSTVAADGDPGVIEIVRADQTDDRAVETAAGFVRELGWTPVAVHDVPGLLSRRLQLALEAEAMRAVEADVATPAEVDAVMEAGFGHVEGALASADRAGLADRLAAMEELADELGPRFEPPAVLDAKVDAGQLGEATGEGFRVWEQESTNDGTENDG